MMPYQDWGPWTLVMGATACGKSAWALDQAKACGGVILNADSQQIYSDLPLLTAQPSAEETKAVRHEGYSLYQATEKTDVAQWLTRLQKILQDVPVDLPRFLVGGTGLYLKAFHKGMSPLPTLPAQEVQHIRHHLRQVTTARMHEQLFQGDPVLAQRVSPQDRQRIGRGLEILWLTGTPLSVWQAQPWQPYIVAHRITTVLIQRTAEDTELRIAERAHLMVEQGLWHEFEVFAQKHAVSTWSFLPFQPVGLATGARVLQGHVTPAQGIVEITTKTRQYAKRQRTWFRHQHVADRVLLLS